MSVMEEKKENEKEKEKEEEVVLDHFYHVHPLTLTESDSEFLPCYGCGRFIFPGETVYKCCDKYWFATLHGECTKMSREIRLSMRPQHTLVQRRDMECILPCDVCESIITGIGYFCSSPDSYGFKIQIGCAPNKGVLKRCIDHPSHPHQLTLLWSPGRLCLSRCDACGTLERGNSYFCIDCQYWIHKNCADLPATADYHHPLSLAFHVPLEYIKFKFLCDICDETRTSTEELNPELQLRGPVTLLRAKKLQGYLQCYVGKKLEDDGADFRQYKLVTVLRIEE